MSRIRLGILLLATLAVPASTLVESEPWQGEVGLLYGNHDNFFFRGAGSPAPSSDLVTGYLRLEKTWDTGRSDWTFELGADAVAVADVDAADYEGFELGVEYKRGRAKAALGYSALLNRVFSESGEAIFFDQATIDFWWRYSLGERWWIRARFKSEDWDFDLLEDDRDADVGKLSLTARFAATKKLGIRVSYLAEDRDAIGPANNRTGDGFELAFEGAPNEQTTWFLRFRSRDRDYEDAAPDDRNFRRSDTTDEINFNLRWTFVRQLGLYVRNNYRSGDSTRVDRNYTGNVVEAGLFFSF